VRGGQVLRARDAVGRGERWCALVDEDRLGARCERVVGMLDQERAIRRERDLAGLGLGDPEPRGADIAAGVAELLGARRLDLDGDQLRVGLRRFAAIAALPRDVGEPPRDLAPVDAVERAELFEVLAATSTRSTACSRTRSG
jgi:hypothetical protein